MGNTNDKHEPIPVPVLPVNSSAVNTVTTQNEAQLTTITEKMPDDADLNIKLQDLKLNQKTDINILLLGETGVGKSTFINSIVNYLTYTHLKKAEEENLLTLIPSKCTIRDKNGKDHIVKIGSAEDQNEYLDTGVSATQDVKTYVFPIWNGQSNVRLIDTPGMGDTRGVQQDDINCENILTYISQLHELHAICFLFKPTNTRITKFFDYCMAQIFSRLDKSASKNFIFIFTNTRGTDYGPGDTFSILQEVVKDIESSRSDVKIPLNRNVFCFDNEGFRYLAAVKQGVEFDNSAKQKNGESWKKSVEQCWGLIKYIVGDTRNPPLKPHFIKSTNAINESRRMIIRLSQPLAEITQLINDNLHALQRHTELLNVNSNSLEELKKKLFMPIIDLKVIKLTQPVTVCTSSQCAEIYRVGDINKWHYKQKCHDPCYLTNVPKEIIGSPELVHCAAMNSSGVCQKCSCQFSVHMHIYYISQTFESRKVDDTVQQNINDKEQVMQNAKKLINKISQKKDELDKEHEVIVRCCARFAHFLQANAITPFNDSYKDYIEYLIFREKSLGMQSNRAVVYQLEKLMREYDEAKKSFDEALQLKQRLGEYDVFVTPQKIQESIQELYKLKHNGKKIKELYECQKTSRSKEHQYTEYVHKFTARLEKSADKGAKKKDKGDDVQNNNPQKKNLYQQKNPQQKNPQQQKNLQQKTKGNVKEGKHRVRAKSQPRTPPPSYQDANSNFPPSNQQHPPHSSGQYPPPPHHAPYHPPYHPPGPYAPPPPPPQGAYAPHGPDPYYYTGRYEPKGPSEQSGNPGYEVKISVVKPAESRNVPHNEYSPTTPHPHHNYDYSRSYSQGSYAPPPSGHYPPPGAPSSYYPPPIGSSYPPPSTSGYLPPGAYPPPPAGYPHHYGAGSYDHNQVSQPHAHQGRDRGGGNRQRGKRGRGGKGQADTGRAQKFKKGFHKKKNDGGKGNDTDSDEGSDTSATSSKH